MKGIIWLKCLKRDSLLRGLRNYFIGIGHCNVYYVILVVQYRLVKYKAAIN